MHTEAHAQAQHHFRPYPEVRAQQQLQPSPGTADIGLQPFPPPQHYSPLRYGLSNGTSSTARVASDPHAIMPPLAAAMPSRPISTSDQLTQHPQTVQPQLPISAPILPHTPEEYAPGTIAVRPGTRRACRSSREIRDTNEALRRQ